MTTHPKFSAILLRVTLFLFLLLASFVTIIHSQPFDDGGLRTLMLTSDCSTPCFLGIRSGITTLAQARELLESSGLVSSWIEPLSGQSTDDSSLGLLRWTWSSLRPSMLTGKDASLLYNKKTGLVVGFGGMSTQIPLSTLMIELGRPTLGFMSGNLNDRDRPTFVHVAAYPELHLDAVSYVQCPMLVSQLLSAPVTFELASTIDENSRLTIYPSNIRPIVGAFSSFFCN